MFKSKLEPEWKIVFGTFSVMVLGVGLLLAHGNLVILPDAILFGAGAMWTSGGILTAIWGIQIIRKKKQSEKS